MKDLMRVAIVRMFNVLKKEIKAEVNPSFNAVKNEDISEFKNAKEDAWDFTAYRIIEFVFDPKAVIIQYTDEYTDEGLVEMKQHIKKEIIKQKLLEKLSDRNIQQLKSKDRFVALLNIVNDIG